MRIRGICSLADCSKPHKAKSYCGYHYNKLRAYGDPLAKKNIRGGYYHGMSKTPTWYSWVGMIERVTNPKYKQFKDYGGRGIKVCDHWLTKRGFMNFLDDMGIKPSGHSLDRINPDGDYEVSNCRWATFSQQRLNRRQNNV